MHDLENRVVALEKRKQQYKMLYSQAAIHSWMVDISSVLLQPMTYETYDSSDRHLIEGM